MTNDDRVDVAGLPADAELAMLGVLRQRPAKVLRDLGVSEPVRRFDVLKHHAGKRCTLLAHTDRTRYVVKLFGTRSDRVAGVLTALAGADLPGVRPPRLVGWDRDRHVVVTDHYDGPSLDRLIDGPSAGHVGRLIAAWTSAVASAEIRIGRLLTPALAVDDMAKFRQDAVDPNALRRWTELVDALATDPPALAGTVLVHGSTKLDHFFDGSSDAGGAPMVGLVDWDGYHQGAPEFDVATTLANLDAAEVTGESPGLACRDARATLLAGTERFTDGAALSWYRALALGKIVGKLARRHDPYSWDAADALASQADEHLRAWRATRW